MSPDQQTDLKSFLVRLTSKHNLQEEQLLDPDVQLVIDLKKNQMPKPPLFAWQNNPNLKAFWNCWEELHLSDDLLVRIFSDKSSSPKRTIVLPRHMIQRVLQSLHSGPSGGHMGMHRTFERVRGRFFWPKMKETV